MSCTRCGGSMQAARKNVRYDAAGLNDVLLRSVEIRRCRWCDEYQVVLPHLGDLHRVIDVIIGKRGRLLPAEIRFLRKHLGWSSASLATHLGVTPLNDLAVGDRHDPDGRHRRSIASTDRGVPRSSAIFPVEAASRCRMGRFQARSYPGGHRRRPLARVCRVDPTKA